MRPASTTDDTATTQPLTTSRAVPLSILFVCLGNICRSPMAEGVFRSQLSSTTPHNVTISPSSIDSAGTGAYHVSSPPDPRTMSVLAAHNITSYTHSARKIRAADFEDFDYIFAMDAENLENLAYEREKAVRRRVAAGKKAGKEAAMLDTAGFLPAFAGDAEEIKRLPLHLRTLRVGKAGDGFANVMLFGAFGGRDPDEEVGDPYYGGHDGFEIAHEQVDRFSRGLLAWLEVATSSPAPVG